MSSPVTLLVEVVMGTQTHPSSSPVPGLLPFSSILFDYPWIFIHLYESYNSCGFNWHSLAFTVTSGGRD